MDAREIQKPPCCTRHQGEQRGAWRQPRTDRDGGGLLLGRDLVLVVTFMSACVEPTRARLTVGQEVGSFESQLTLRPSSSIITHSNRVSSNQSLCCRETEFSGRRQIGQNGFKGSGTP